MKLLVAPWGLLATLVVGVLGYGLSAWLMTQATGWAMWIGAWVMIWLTTMGVVVKASHAIMVIGHDRVFVNGERISRADLVAVQVSSEPTSVAGIRLIKLPGASPVLVRQGTSRRFADEVVLSGFHAFTEAGAHRACARIAAALGMAEAPRVADRAPRHAA